MLSEPCRLEDSAIGKGSQTTSSTSSTAPNPQAMALYQQILGQAQNVAQTPYQAYTGQLTAPVNAQQTAGINNINANANSAQPYINQAAGLATGAANPLTASQIQNYQNPYTQDVVNATQAQFNDQNAQQQAALKGNQISQGALGGNRTGIASSSLAGQQQLSQAPTIANLYAQSYNSGLGTAAQQYQQNPLAAAGSLANFGISGQNAALQGAGQQINAGTLQQQTQQAQDTANYGQYAQAQAYPFQTAQWLASIGTGVAPGLGTTTTGTTTGPPPNQTAQYAGLGLTAASLALSDRRAKRNVHRIGRTNDGQPLFRYQYHGSDQWHIGPIAQEVEKSHPDAVHQGSDGYKYVDLKEATDDSVRRASGGFVQPMAVGGTPWSFADGWVPTVSGLGNAAPHASSAPSAQNPQTPSMDLSKIGNIKPSANGIFSPNGMFGSASYGGGNVLSGDEWGGSSSMPAEGLTADDYGPGFASGGFVRGYADGGMPTMDDRFAPVVDAIQSGDFDPQGGNATDFKGMPGIAAANHGVVPLPVARADTSAPVPVVADDDDEASPPNATPTAGVGAPVTPYARDDAKAGFSRPAPDTDSPRGFGLGFLSPNAQTGLLTAGLGMLASRSPFLGNAVGEGALQGLNAYGAANAADTKSKQDALKQRMEERRVDMEAQRLAQTINTADLISDGKGGLKPNPAKLDFLRKQADINQKDNWSVLPGDGVNTPDRVFNKATGEFKEVPPGKGQAALNTIQNGQFNYSSGGPQHINKGDTLPEPVPVGGMSPETLKSDAAMYAATGVLPRASVSPRTPAGVAQAQYRRAVENYAITAGLAKGLTPEAMADLRRFGVNAAKFPLSRQGDQTVAIGTAIRHINSLEEYAKAWDEAKGNVNAPILRQAAAKFATILGKSEPTNLEQAARIAGPEIIKAIGVAGAGTGGERVEQEKGFQPGASTEQILGSANVARTFLAGQLPAKEAQARNVGFPHERFMDMVGPQEYDYLSVINHSSRPAGEGATAAPAAAPPTKVINGVTYVNRNGQWFQQ